MLTAHDAAVILAVTAGAGVAGVAVGSLALRALGRRPLRWSVGVVIATAVLVMASGITAIGWLMLVSGHTLAVLVAVVLAAAVAAGAVAAILVRRVGRSSALLAEAVRRVGAEAAYEPIPTQPTRELTTLSEELASASHRLAESRRRERALEASRRELVAWVSHDLRTPLAGVRAMAEALEDGVVDDPASVQEYHRRIRVEADRLSRLVDDLFELSRIHAGALRLSLAAVPLADVVSDVLAATDPLARRKGVRLAARADATPVAYADAQQVGRVLRNLVANALRHTPADGTVEVVCAVDEHGTPVLTVSDACGGIPEGELPRLFEVGYRGESARTPGDEHGAGLGLAIARGIVDAHHGSIDVRNSGPGCSFVVRLPALASA